MNMKWIAVWIGLLLCNRTTAQNSGSTWVWHFANKAGNALLTTGEAYNNKFGEPLIIRHFKYYISHLAVGDSLHQFTELSSDTYLVNQAAEESCFISLPMPAGSVHYIRFVLGVDSSKNVSGVQTGPLDPMQGMFWTWNSGYIMAKLEGRSPVSKAPGNYFTYDVGGYRKGEQAQRTIELKLEAPLSDTLTIEADALRFFYGRHNIKIAEHPVCHEPGILAMQLADNYASMFSIAAPQ